MVNKNNWSKEFDQLDTLLFNTRQYWQISPFSCLELPWKSNPQLQNSLLSLTSDTLEQLDNSDKALRLFIEPLISTKLDIINDLPIRKAAIEPTQSYFKAGIKGRKWSQIERFESLLPIKDQPVVEWCSGKGHLGRLISLHRKNSVTSLEWQKDLCHQGTSLAAKYNIDQNFIEADAFSPEVINILKPSQHVVALHACGDLHAILLKHSAKKQVSGLSIAPCCYHLTRSTYYQPLSIAAKRSNLHLSHQDLNLSMQQTVVAKKRNRGYRTTEVAWRLGFDLLQRHLRASNEYLTLPSIKQSLLTGTFENFCHWACDIKKLTLTADISFDDYEQQGYQRQSTNKRIELVTHAFRQLIERWLLLDRVIFMEEQGYNVSLFNFCESTTTPRNAMIQAIKKL